MDSMTAFATAEQGVPGGRLVWEVRGVNHRFLDLSLRLPEGFRGLEGRCREYLRQRLRRGKCELTLRYQHDDPAATDITLDEQRLEALLAVCQRLQRCAEATQPDALTLLSWPGVIRENAPDSERLHDQVMALLVRLVDEFCRARATEGQAIAALLETRCHLLQDEVDRVRARLPALLAAQRQRLEDRLSALTAAFDADRLEQEMVIMAQRSDVAEELDRLEAHLVEVRRLCVSAEPVGRRLDFLMQELNREANTLASKSLSLATTQAAVEMKVLIEQMREQIQNIE